MNSKKAKKVEKIRREIENLKNSPLYKERIDTNALPVIGEGSLDAKIMFIGEAPGKNEVEKGIPFCGRAGQILNEMFETIKTSREDVYITNIIMDRLPNNRDPFPEEIDIYTPFLDRQINIIQPNIIATLGRFSMSYILNKYVTSEMLDTIGRNHGKIFEGQTSFGKILIVPLYHPVATIYNKNTRDDLKKDFKILKKLSL